MKKKREDRHSRAASEPEQAVRGRERRWEGVVKEPGSDRADKYAADVEKVLSRSQIKARNAKFLVNGKPCKASRPLKAGEKLSIEWIEELSRALVPERIELSILFENDRVFVVDKAQGMVTHPASGNWRGTLANAILGLENERSAQGGVRVSPDELEPLRGGIVHRLDKDTSGTIIVARDLEARDFLAAQFKARTVRKEYVAIVRGMPIEARGRIQTLLARDPKNRKKFAVSEVSGKLAATEYRVIKSWRDEDGAQYAFVALYPKTGRTHQLRVHMAYAGCPILGDPIYGKKDALFPEATLMLHARRLKITLPGKNEPSVFISPLPDRFRKIFLNLRRGESV